MFYKSFTFYQFPYPLKFHLKLHFITKGTVDHLVETPKQTRVTHETKLEQVVLYKYHRTQCMLAKVPPWFFLTSSNKNFEFLENVLRGKIICQAIGHSIWVHISIILMQIIKGLLFWIPEPYFHQYSSKSSTSGSKE